MFQYEIQSLREKKKERNKTEETDLAGIYYMYVFWMPSQVISVLFKNSSNSYELCFPPQPIFMWTMGGVKGQRLYFIFFFFSG